MHFKLTEQHRAASLSFDLAVCKTTNIYVAKNLPF